ncbi:MAG TPA: amidohydrolase family protein [Acidimicrobiales bacterium]|nr:amidohydrolase family protein [Acidimicrobiales bacterium]
MDRLVIAGGTVVDGTGASGYAADVAVEGDRVIEIGVGLRGDRRLDGSGCIVAPGFVDIHTHYDAQVFWDPGLTPSCFHGVTTVVAGNCGFSIAPTRPTDRDLLGRTMEKVEDMDPECLAAGIPWTEFESFPEYLDAVRRRGSALNFSAYIGHTPLRLYVMGPEAADRPAKPHEIAAMVALIEEAMDAGAAGFATSMAVTHVGADGRPIPSRVAEKEEIHALGQAVGRSGRGVVGVNGGENLSFTDCYDMQPSLGAPITYTAVLTVPNGAHLKAAEIHRQGRARGADVWPQVSCRPLSFSMTMVEPFTLNTSPVFAELMPRSLDDRRAAYADPAWRQRVRDAWSERKGVPPRWDTYEIMESASHPDLVGRKLTAIAEDQGTHPFDALLDLAVAERDIKALRVKAILANDDPDGVAMLLNEPGCTLGLSDAGAHVGQLCDAPLPTDLLGGWVRDRQVLPLEAAVHKLTQEPADLFGFADRGVLREGAFADITVFDPDTVGPGPVRRVRDFPADSERLTADRPSGVRHVLVNGTPIRVDEAQLDAATRPGRVVSPAPRERTGT